VPINQLPKKPDQPKDKALVGYVEEQVDQDLTLIPQQLEKKFEEIDEDNQLHPTIIKIGGNWTKWSTPGLLVPEQQTSLPKNVQKEEKEKAFDLLDSLTRSGGLSVDFATVHVVIATTHVFDKTLLNTVIQDNQNPIEKVERSTLIMATTIHGLPAKELIKPQFLEPVAEFSPKLFIEN